MATLGVEDVSDDDVRRAAEVVERAEGGSRESRRRAWTPGVRRALIVVSVFFIFQQITGINVRLYYGPHLLGPYFSGAHASLVDTTVAGVEVTLIMTAVNVAATYLGFRWIDTFGRKPLAIGGWTLQGEVFPTAVRGQAAAFCAMIDWLANFLIIEIFPVTQNAIGLDGVLVICRSRRSCGSSSASRRIRCCTR